MSYSCPIFLDMYRMLTLLMVGNICKICKTILILFLTPNFFSLWCKSGTWYICEGVVGLVGGVGLCYFVRFCRCWCCWPLYCWPYPLETIYVICCLSSANLSMLELLHLAKCPNVFKNPPNPLKAWESLPIHRRAKQIATKLSQDLDNQVNNNSK